jgi:hypothetical protein
MGEVLFAPAEVLDRGVKLFFGRRDDALAVEGDKVFLAFDSRIERWADAPDAGAVFGVGARSDQKTIHGPMVVRAKCKTVVRFVIVTDTERDDVSRFDQGEFLVEFDADAASRAPVIVDFEDCMSERTVSPWRLLAQGWFRRSSFLLASERGELLPELGEVSGD